MSINNLTNVITKPTRVTHNTATLVDPILISDKINVIQAHVVDVKSNISDPRATVIMIKLYFLTSTCSRRKVWYYERADCDELKRLKQTENWDFIDFINPVAN